MGDAKKIVLRPIDSKIANQFIERVHYSGKLVKNSKPRPLAQGGAIPTHSLIKGLEPSLI